MSWSDTLFGILTGKGFVGNKLRDFTDSVGLGSSNYLQGKTFTTTDTGSTLGAGTGVGTGISGLIQSSISSQIFSDAASRFGSTGIRLTDLCDAIAEACVMQMLLAELISDNPEISSGEAVIDIGSFNLDAGGWGSSIEGQGLGVGFMGSQWPNFAAAIGFGKAEETLSVGTGTLVIGAGEVGTKSGAGTGTITNVS